MANDGRNSARMKSEYLRLAGNEAYRHQQFASAIRFYTEAIDIFDSEAVYFTNRAAAFMELNLFRAAIADCRRAEVLQKHAPSPRTLLRLVKCQLSNGAIETAIATLKKLHSIEPCSFVKTLMRKTSDIVDSLEKSSTDRMRKKWPSARSSLLACMDLMKSINGTVISATWYCWLAEIEIGRKDLDAAAEVAEEAIIQYPMDSNILEVQGLIQFLIGNLAASKCKLQAALEEKTSESAVRLQKQVQDVQTLKERGNACFSKSLFKCAWEQYTKALKIVGHQEENAKGGRIRAILLANRAAAYFHGTKYQLSLADCIISLDLYPKNYKALRTRARVSVRLKEYEAAIRDFRMALSFATDTNPTEVSGILIELQQAEDLLKRATRINYYNVMGLSPSSTALEIKKAYKRLCLKHHPDKGGNEDEFKLLQEAYETLSDPDKKKQYDMDNKNNA